MGFREPGCNVLDDWRKYGEPAIRVSRPACYWCSVLQGRFRLFGEEAQWAVSV